MSFSVIWNRKGLKRGGITFHHYYFFFSLLCMWVRAYMCTWEREREGRVVFSKPKAKGEEGKKKHVAWSNNKARESMSHVARRYQITSWPQHPSPHLFLILICSFLSSFLLSRCFSYWYPVIYHKFTAVFHDIILLSYVVNHCILLHHKD